MQVGGAQHGDPQRGGSRRLRRAGEAPEGTATQSPAEAARGQERPDRHGPRGGRRKAPGGPDALLRQARTAGPGAASGPGAQARYPGPASVSSKTGEASRPRTAQGGPRPGSRGAADGHRQTGATVGARPGRPGARATSGRGAAADRKSTRLNSSHGYISYAV